MHALSNKLKFIAKTFPCLTWTCDFYCSSFSLAARGNWKNYFKRRKVARLLCIYEFHGALYHELCEFRSDNSCSTELQRLWKRDTMKLKWNICGCLHDFSDLWDPTCWLQFHFIMWAVWEHLKAAKCPCICFILISSQSGEWLQRKHLHV